MKSPIASKKRISDYIKIWTPTAIWAIVIFSFSAIPTNPVSEIYWQDFIVKKLAHIIEYGIFATLLYRSLKLSGISPKDAIIYSLITSFLYGVSDEFHQSFTPGREPKARDVLFDTFGAAMFLFLLNRVLPKSPKRIRLLAKKFDF